MNIEEVLREKAVEIIKSTYGTDIPKGDLIINTTPNEFTGQLTLVVFPFLKFSKKSPQTTAEEIGSLLSNNLPEEIRDFNVIKGFLNLEIADSYWLDFLRSNYQTESFGRSSSTGEKIVLEYCGPNTNKPLHLGHIRNMLLGHSVATILEFNGHEVHKVNIYNDRGIAICKSMVAWIRSNEQATPESSGVKGDHLVGNYYVEFDRMYRQEIDALMHEGKSKEEAEKEVPIMRAAQEMLRKWEAGDEETLELWRKMNGWVYEGFEKTYERLGVEFEKNYYESETYILGKDTVREGLEKGVFYKKEDGSVWVDLTDKGLDEKILLRSDGTSVYLTQDLGTAQLRYDDYHMDRSIYVVADEQDYHFKVLKLTLEKLGKPYAEGIHHLSYGMVDLPSGKMKSREGTVVDADDLIDQMLETAAYHTKELGKIEDFTDGEAQDLYRKIGLGALKFFMLKVDPKKRMLFDPEASIDFHGQTGPFVQYTYARIQSVLRKAGSLPDKLPDDVQLNEIERDLMLQLHQFPNVVKDAGEQYEPSLIGNYVYQLAKTYNKFYAEHSILQAEAEPIKNFRLALSIFVANIIRSACELLGIEVPERM